MPTLELAEGAGGGGGAGGLAALAGPIGIAAGAAPVAGKEIYDLGMKAWQTGFQFAAIANPAVTDRFNRSMLDMEAVIGHKMLPVVNVATDAVRAIGGSMIDMLPSAQDVSNVMDELKPAIAELRDAAHDAAPTIKDVLIVTLKEAGKEIKAFATTVHYFVEANKFLNQTPKNEKPKGDDTGMAAGPAHIGTIEDVSRSLFQNALEQGRGESFEAKTATNTQKILEFLQTAKWWTSGGIGELLPNISSLTKLTDAIVEAVQPKPQGH